MNKYNQPLVWEQRTTTIDVATGEHKEAFPVVGTLNAYIEYLGGGSETDDYGVKTEIVTAMIHVNQWPNISHLDRLIDKRFGDTWYLDAVVRSHKPLELKIQATRKRPTSTSENVVLPL